MRSLSLAAAMIVGWLPLRFVERVLSNSGMEPVVFAVDCVRFSPQGGNRKSKNGPDRVMSVDPMVHARRSLRRRIPMGRLIRPTAGGRYQVLAV